jgi:hypothetical protein
VTFFSGGGSGFGQRTAMFDGSASRSQILGRKYQPFSNPFFDHASTYTPPNVKSLFGFCRFYHLTHGVINAIHTKASEYAVTDLILQHKDRAVTDKWEDLLLGSMNYRVLQFEINLDYFVYGNAFVSPSFPFRKLLTCANCRVEHDALESKAHWRYLNHRFWLTCTKCHQTDFARADDRYYPKYNDITLIRWNPENVQLFYNETTNRVDYLLDVGSEFRSQITMGRKDLVATTPELFLDAVRLRRAVVFDKQEVFHLRRPSLSGTNRGWGIPLSMPVLKDAYYVQIMKKAQESVLLTHLVPQVFLFPQPATAGADPFTTVHLQSWREHIRRELARQRMDPSYYGILPFPLGHQVIGENGRSLLLMPEIRAMTEMICVGMGFPSDLVFGQGTYAGSSVSMRMLENFFLSNVHSQHRLLQWVLRRLSGFTGWPVPTARFKPFRMADDLQRQALMFQLNSAGKISDTTLLSHLDLKVEDETALQINESQYRSEAIRQQQLTLAEVNAEAQAVMAKAQAKSQAAMMQAQAAAMAPPRDPFAEAQSSPVTGPAGVPLDAAAAALAQEIRRMPPERQASILAQVQVSQPELASMMMQDPAMAGMAGMPEMPGPQAQAAGAGGAQGGQAAGAPPVDMRPMPAQLPPRRAGT